MNEAVANKRILGASLKRPSNGKQIVTEWDPASIDADILGKDLSVKFAYTPSDKVKTVKLHFINSNNTSYPILEVRSSGDAGKEGKLAYALQWLFSDQRKAWAGKGKEALKLLFPDKTSEFELYIRKQDYLSAAKCLLKLLGLDINIEDNIQPGSKIAVGDNEEFINNLAMLLNISIGFRGTNRAGERITAPYIKVH